MMRNFISSMDMNPYWTVPMGIFGRDKLPRLRSIENKFSQDREARDAAVIKWFNNNHFDLVRDNGGNSGQWEVLSPLDVADWTQVTAGQLIGQGIYLRQKQGLNNALGTVRFNLNGDSSIYLHDTNEREMFDSPYRLRSSGCVRVQFATELASTLAQDSDLCDTQYCRESSNPQQEIKKMIPPYLQNDELKLTNVRLSKQVFVYLVFLTTTQERYFSSSPRGGVQFHFDFYGQNKMIFEAIARGLD
jgi:murein L,D-transpeptidase YcbB/YkuD